MAPWRRAPLALVLALGGPLSVPAQPAREPEFTMVDFADDQELARHLPPEDHLFTSRRLAADLVDIFGGTGTAAAWTVLELGSAHGHTTEVLSALFARVIAVDLLTSAHRAAAARGAGARGNVVWLTLDAYRDPWLSLLAGNDIQVAFVDALHSRDAVAADLRACAQLPGLRYVLVHDFNFADIRQAVAASARSFALVAALGEARRIPLHERRDRAEAPKFPEAVLLRPAGGLALRAGGRAADEAEPEVAAAVARFLQDPQLAAMASRAGDAIAAEAPPGPTAPAFPELCGATYLLLEEEAPRGAAPASVSFRCARRGGVAAGPRGRAERRGPGRNATSAEWRAEAGGPGGAADWVWLRPRGRVSAGGALALVPSASRRALSWAARGAGAAAEASAVAVEASAVAHFARAVAGPPPPQGPAE